MSGVKKPGANIRPFFITIFARKHKNWNNQEMGIDFDTRGEAFRRAIRRIAQEDRRVGDDIILFDEYTIMPLLKKPLRTGFLVAVNVLEGKGRAMVNSVEYEFEAPCLLVFVPGQVFRLTDDDDRLIRTRVMLLSEPFMKEFYGMSFKMNEIYATLLINPIISLDDYGSSYLDLYVKSCILTISDKGNPRRMDIVRHLTIALFYGALIGICHENEGSGNRTAQICSAFMSILKTDYSVSHRLEHYASKLFISSRYLSICVKSVTGKTPSYWIDFYLISEAKRLLRETGETVDMISDRLGFVSQSVFGKFFRRLTGMNPSEFRNRKKRNIINKE